MIPRLILAAIALSIAGLAHAAEPATADLDHLAGQPVDLAPWAYSWRADRTMQEKPEAYFIPHRLDRIDKIYRTAATALPPDQLKSIFYNMPDVLKPLPPAPKMKLATGLLWTGSVSRYQVELHWPNDLAKIPSPDDVEVRVYPTSFGWFGWTVDQILTHPEISADHRTWIYHPDPNAKMDSFYNQRVDSATEMVAVFSNQPAIPRIAVTGASLGKWKRMNIEVEWGFTQPIRKTDFRFQLEPHVAIRGSTSPLSSGRKGIALPVLYAPDARPGLDSRITFRSGDDAFTISLHDLDAGPILIADRGIFITQSGTGQTATQFLSELRAKHLMSICQMTRMHPEVSSWEDLMLNVRLWTCPVGTKIPPLAAVPDPPMQVQLSDQHWTDAWRAASAQLQGPHMWGGLAFEVGRVAREMEMIGLHDKAEEVYNHFLSAPGAKSDGDYTDGSGALELAASMRHDIGYAHDGTHASTGRLLFAMCERYFLTGDRAWFAQHRVRLQAAADWIIRQRNSYMKDIPNRKDLFVAGLMPPEMLGDYALPSCDWHFYYCDNAFALQGLSRFADVLADIDPQAAPKYRAESDSFRNDLIRVATRDAQLAPVRLGRDGMYHSYIPRMAYAAGLTGPELGAPQFPDCDMFMGALPLAEPFAALSPDDWNMNDTLDLMEEMGTNPTTIAQQTAAKEKIGVSTDDAWFWVAYSRLPKASHNANIYLLRDDIPNFLRFWMNEYAIMVGANGKFPEPWQPGVFADVTNPDNGTAGWFMENFRNLLVMEDADSLWIARATPRAWLDQGKHITVRNAPTYFGNLSYTIVSDTDHGTIYAAIDIPSRKQASLIRLRLRHPTEARLKSVTVNGKPWKEFDAAQEIILLQGFTGKISVGAHY